jgi:hypothetical protein
MQRQEMEEHRNTSAESFASRSRRESNNAEGHRSANSSIVHTTGSIEHDARHRLTQEDEEDAERRRRRREKRERDEAALMLERQKYESTLLLTILIFTAAD